MDVGLVADVEQDRLGRRVEDPVQRDGQLDHAEVGAEVAAGAGDGLHQQVADLGGEGGELRLVEGAQVGRRREPIQYSRHARSYGCAVRIAGARPSAGRPAAVRAGRRTRRGGSSGTRRRPAARQPPARRRGDRDVAGQRRRVAGDVADRPRAQREQRRHDVAARRRPAAGRARRGPGRRPSAASGSAVTRPAPTSARGRSARLAAGVGDRPRRRTRRRRTAPSGPTASASSAVSAPAPAYRSRTVSPGCGATGVEQRGGERLGRGRVHLPEPAGRTREGRGPATSWCSRSGPATTATRSGGRRPRACRPGPGGVPSTASRPRRPSRGPASTPVSGRRPRLRAVAERRAVADAGDAERAVVDRLDRRASGAGAGPGGRRGRRRRALRVRQPSSPPGSSSTPSSRSRDVEAGQPVELLAHHRRLERALRGAGGVLPVAAAAAARARRTGTAARPGPATASSTSTASAQQKDPPRSSVTRARTRSPGSACRTNTPPARRAGRTHEPPCAGPPIVSSSVGAEQRARAQPRTAVSHGRWCVRSLAGRRPRTARRRSARRCATARPGRRGGSGAAARRTRSRAATARW